MTTFFSQHFGDKNSIKDDKGNELVEFRTQGENNDYLLINNSNNSNVGLIATGNSEHVDLTLGGKGVGRVNVIGSDLATGGLKIYDGSDIDTSNYIELYVPSGISGNTSYKLPLGDGSNGQFLQTNGSGELSWGSSVISSIKLNEIQNGNANASLINEGGFIEIKTQGESAYNGSNAIVLASNGGVNDTIEIHNTRGIGTDSLHFVSNLGGMYIDTAKEIVLDTDDNITLDSGNSNLVVRGDSIVIEKADGGNNSNVIIEVNGTSSNISLNVLPKGGGRLGIFGSSNTGGIKLYNGSSETSNYIEFYSNISMTSNYAYKLPSTDGSNGQFLQTNGSGELSWGVVATQGGNGSSAADDITPGDASVSINTTSGFIEIKNDGDFNSSNSILLTSNSGSSETIEIHNIQGIGTDALHFVSNLGGMYVDTSKNIVLDSGDDIRLYAIGDIILDAGSGNVSIKDNGSNIIVIGHDGTNNWNITNETSDGDINFVVNDGGSYNIAMTVDGSTSNIGIGTTDSGNYKLNVNGDTNISSSLNVGTNAMFGGSMNIGTTLVVGTTIQSGSINSTGSSIFGDGTKIGDLTIGNGTIQNTLSFTEIKVSGSYANRSNAIVITSNSGISETIEIHNTMGTGDDSINLTSHKGGINMDASSNIVLNVGATGNVGINNTFPQFTLDVDGDINLTGNIYVDGTMNGSSAIIPSMRAWIYEGDGITAPDNKTYAYDEFIAFNREHFDTYNAFNVGSSGYTVPITGKYLISVNLYINYTPSDYSYVAVLKNPGGENGSNTVIMTTNTYGEGGQSMCGVFDLVENDVIKIKNISPTSIDIAAGQGYTEWSMYMINYGHTFTHYYQPLFDSISLTTDDVSNSNYFKVSNVSADIIGRNLLIQAGNTSVTASSGNIDGGDLVLKSGHSSGTGSSKIQFWTNPATDDTPPVNVVNIDNTGNVNIKNGSGGLGNSITFMDSLSNIGSFSSGVMDIRSNFINLEASSNVIIKSNGTQSLHFGYQDLRNDGVSGGEWNIVNTDSNSNIHLVTTDINGAQNNVIVADSYGNVGIGTTNPQGQLHISSGSGSNGDCKLILQADSDNSNENSTPVIEFWADGFVQAGGIYLNNNELVIANSVSNGGIDIKTSSTDGYQNAMSKLFITTSGQESIHLKSSNGEMTVASFPVGWTGGPKWMDGLCQSLYVNGSITYSSDDRLKTNKQYITDATTTLLKLKPEIYDRATLTPLQIKDLNDIANDENKTDIEKNEAKTKIDNNIIVHEAGLIVQDIYYDVPELRYILEINDSNPLPRPQISSEPNIDADYDNLGWSKQPASIHYNNFIPYLIKSIQELHARIEVLENN